MFRRADDPRLDEQTDADERLGEAIEAFLTLVEEGSAPEIDAFVEDYTEIREDLRSALEGLQLVQGLVGSSRGAGVGIRLESGRRIAGYRIVRELGRGGMGVVYEAVHVDLDRPVALKVLGAAAGSDTSGRRRFLNEARTAAGLHHTNIVPVFDVGQVGGLCYYAMQRIEGSGLDRVLKHLRQGRETGAGSNRGRSGSRTRAAASPPPSTLAATSSRVSDSTEADMNGGSSVGRSQTAIGTTNAGVKVAGGPPPFEPPRGSAYYRWVASVGLKAADALSYAHQRGIIHRDVKPSNILIDAGGAIWVADFGLARRLADPSQTQLDGLLGTPRYMSPEQARIGPIDGRCDVYSLGATLYELLTLRPPFDGRSAVELIEQIAGKEPPQPRSFDERLPRDLETIVLKALAKRREDRYENAAELAEDLGRFLRYEPVKARRISPIGKLWRLGRRHPGASIVAMVSAAAVIASTSFAYVQVVHERDDALHAREQLEGVNIRLASARRTTQEAMRELLYRQAAFVRVSNASDRRSRGLDLIKQAADLEADLDLKTRLRDEAVALLSLRDVEKRSTVAVDGAENAAFISDSERLVILSGNGRILTTRDLAKNETIATFEMTGLGRRQRFGSMSRGMPWFKPWPRLATAGTNIAAVNSDDSEVLLFENATDAPVGRLELGEREIRGIAISGDGRRILTLSSDPPAGFGTGPGGPDARSKGRERPPEFQVHLWDAERPGAPVALLSDQRPDSSEVSRFAPHPLASISPDGNTIATGWIGHRKVFIRDRDGRVLETLEVQDELTALALGPEGLFAAACSGVVQLWDLDSSTPLPTLSPHQGYVSRLRFSPGNGTLLAAAGWASGVDLWDVATTTRLATLPPNERLSDLAFSSNGGQIAVAESRSVTTWAVLNPLARSKLSGLKETPLTLAFGPGRSVAFGGFRSSNIRLWDPSLCPLTAPAEVKFPAGFVTFDAKERLVTVDSSKLSWYQNPSTLERSLPLPLLRREPAGQGRSWEPFVSFSKTQDDRAYVLIRSRDVFLWRADEPNRLAKLAFASGSPGSDHSPSPVGGDSPYYKVAVSPDARRLYFASGRNEGLSAWNVDGDTLRPDWSLFGEVGSFSLAPDGESLAFIRRGRSEVAIVETKSGRILRRLPTLSEDGSREAYSLAYAPSGKELAVGHREYIHLWNLEGPEPRLVMRLPSHRDAVRLTVFSREGDRLVSSGDDKTVNLWNLSLLRSELERIGLGW